MNFQKRMDNNIQPIEDYKMSNGKLKEPKVITDYKQRTVCLLPVGFYFNDERWEKYGIALTKKGRR